jgi:hypothetical protein
MFQIYFHGKNRESLLNHIDARYLPIKYGGTMDLPEFNRMDFYDLLCKHEDEFEGKPYEVIEQLVAPITCGYCTIDIIKAQQGFGFIIGLASRVICDGPSDTGVDFSPNSSLFLCLSSLHYCSIYTYCTVKCKE